MQSVVAPSVLASDFANLQKEIEMLNRSQADWIHVDVMDGVFVPNISFGMPVCKAIKQHAQKPLDVHLMIVDPDRYIEDFQQAGANHITVHYEACTHLQRALDMIKQSGCKAGVAINPHTPIHLLEDIIGMTDIVLVMSVNPGFGGQSFIERTYHKIRQLKQLIQQEQTDTLIEIDGGVNNQNAYQLLEAGADVLVAGSFVFKADKPEEVIAQLKEPKKS